MEIDVFQSISFVLTFFFKNAFYDNVVFVLVPFSGSSVRGKSSLLQNAIVLDLWLNCAAFCLFFWLDIIILCILHIGKYNWFPPCSLPCVGFSLVCYQ